MKRLTMWYDGNQVICENEECTSGDCPFADPICEQVQNIIDRLAAYEDTGMEPEEVTELCEMDRRAKMAEMQYREMPTEVERPEGGLKMERLTEKRDTPLVMSMWPGDSRSLRIYNRLAAYEDTGLEPEEIDKFKKDIKKIKDDVDSLFEKQAFLNFLESKGIDTSIGVNWMCDVFDMLHDEKNNEIIGIDRLRELVQADRDGRCVVQKFAPGSEVWIVERDEDGEATEVSGYVFVASVSGIAIVSLSINDCSDLDFILSDFVEETASGFSGSFSGYPISDCYKSHEDAEAALRREQDG